MKNRTKINLHALSKKDLEDFLRAHSLPAYRMRQLIHWIYEKSAGSLEEITEFSKDLRAVLSDKACLGQLTLLNSQVSPDWTEKFLFGLEDGESIESVLIHDARRLTLCVSTQVGCAMNCLFCLTGKVGFKRNLRAHEIVGQVLTVRRRILPRKITNIVLMGMGEPLANYDEVIEALWRIVDFMKFSPRRITLSTVGIIPKILELPRKAPFVNLAISLNATTDEVREYLMPITKKYPLKALIDACREFPLPRRRRITFEYVLIEDINDTPDDAKRLIMILKGVPSKINLIPFNHYEGTEFERPEDERILLFQELLRKGHLTALIRKSKGQDISAACGQLKGGA
jgi:23S rRNA (adenine2503-C2)-methyltransferase